MKKYRVAVCKGPDCRAGGSDRVFKALQEELQRTGVAARCHAYRGGCFGLCHLGPNVVVRVDTGAPKDPFSREDYQLMGYEGEVHYGDMTPERVPRLVAEHLDQDQPVEEFKARDEFDGR